MDLEKGLGGQRRSSFFREFSCRHPVVRRHFFQVGLFPNLNQGYPSVPAFLRGPQPPFLRRRECSFFRDFFLFACVPLPFLRSEPAPPSDGHGIFKSLTLGPSPSVLPFRARARSLSLGPCFCSPWDGRAFPALQACFLSRRLRRRWTFVSPACPSPLLPFDFLC